MKYLAGLVYAAVAGTFVYLLATLPNEDVALGFMVGGIMSLLLAAASGWFGYSLRK
jgi:hypothetical protein